MPFDLPALRALARRVFRLAGPGARAAPAGVCPQIPRTPAPRAGPLGRRLPGLAQAIPAQGGFLAADRVPALAADARAQHATPGIRLEDPLLPASRAGRLGGGFGYLAPAQAAVLAADDADRGAAARAVPLLLPHLASAGQRGGIDRPRAGVAFG